MRNRYLDFLRAAAIVRVIVYHLFGWPWLSIVLPAMGVMFALAGSLTAASLQKRAAGQVVLSRLRRLLPPLWLLGLILVPIMVYLGWAHERGGDHPLDLAHAWHLAFWIFPLGDPPGSQKAADGWDPLWYIRAYVWFILLSPFLYAAYRKIGWIAVAAPIVAIAVLDKTGFSLPDTADSAMWDFVTFGACWIAGFAHHDGRLRRVRPGLVIAAAVILGAAALYWQQGHQGDDAWDLNDVPESQALWSLAFVLIALRWEPPMAWLARARPLDRLVAFLNARAVTIYLWHNLAITLIWPILAVVTLDDIGHGLDDPVDLLATFALTLIAVFAFGWVEDLAARRRPRFWPAGGAALRPAGEPVPALAGAYPIGGGITPADRGAIMPADPGPGEMAGAYPGSGRGPAAETGPGNQVGAYPVRGDVDQYSEPRPADFAGVYATGVYATGTYPTGTYPPTGTHPTGTYPPTGTHPTGTYPPTGTHPIGRDIDPAWDPRPDPAVVQIGDDTSAGAAAVRRLPPARRPIPWAADVPSLDPARAGITAEPGPAVAGIIRPVIAQVPTGRHAAGEPETAGTLDLGLPTAGTLDLGLPVAGRRAEPPPAARAPLEGQIIDGPPTRWPRPRDPDPDPVAAPDWFHPRDGRPAE